MWEVGVKLMEFETFSLARLFCRGGEAKKKKRRAARVAEKERGSEEGRIQARNQPRRQVPGLAISAAAIFFFPLLSLRRIKHRCKGGSGQHNISETQRFFYYHFVSSLYRFRVNLLHKKTMAQPRMTLVPSHTTFVRESQGAGSTRGPFVTTTTPPILAPFRCIPVASAAAKALQQCRHGSVWFDGVSLDLIARCLFLQ